MIFDIYFVHLRHDRIEHFAFERAEHNRFVLDRVNDEALARLDNAGADAVDRRHCYHETVFSGASALHFGVQLLLDCLHELGPEVLRMQQDLVLQRDLVYTVALWVRMGNA